MKYLKIENGMAFYSSVNKTQNQIDKIDKNDILYLMDKALNLDEDFDMDSPEENEIKIEAHKIIYSSIYENLMELTLNKKEFNDKVSSLYKEAFIKYSNTSNEETDDENLAFKV